MNARELMIGDWVDDTTVHPESKVLGIEDGEVLVKRKSDRWFYRTHESNIKPIPLTPEMVERLSYIKELVMFWDDRKTEETGENWYEACINCDNGNTLTIDIRYVHELQHALRLCRIDKEIEI